MQRQAIIIGLGQFGMSVARALSERRVEVLAIDVREELVRIAAAFVAEAACFDASDTEALARTSPELRDFCLCAIGDENREASIICTALLRQMGARRVIARSNDDVHSRILTLVGAHLVINPEREFGERFANQLVHQNIRGEMSLGTDIRITEVEVPTSFVGQTLGQVQLPRRFGVTVIAVRSAATSAVTLPEPTVPLGTGDILIVVSQNDAVCQMIERA